MNIDKLKPELRKSIVDILIRYCGEEKIPPEKLSIALLMEAFVFYIAEWDVDTWTPEDSAKAVSIIYARAREEVDNRSIHNKSIH
tara:strand:- start:234 stop:488 length:255 start_codon:yes stop_codon:yes gene_type:complete